MFDASIYIIIYNLLSHIVLNQHLFVSKIHLKERIVDMINIIKQEITIDKELKNRTDFICEFCNNTPTFINGSIKNIDKTNISYVNLIK